MIHLVELNSVIIIIINFDVLEYTYVVEHTQFRDRFAKYSQRYYYESIQSNEGKEYIL